MHNNLLPPLRQDANLRRVPKPQLRYPISPWVPDCNKQANHVQHARVEHSPAKMRPSRRERRLSSRKSTPLKGGTELSSFMETWDVPRSSTEEADRTRRQASRTRDFLLELRIFRNQSLRATTRGAGSETVGLRLHERDLEKEHCWRHGTFVKENPGGGLLPPFLHVAYHFWARGLRKYLF